MSFYGTTINDSPTVAGIAAAAISGKEFTAVSYDGNGKIVANATKGKNVLGLLGAEHGDVAAGGTVTVQVKDIGLWKTGAAVAAGAELTSDVNGKAVTAAAGEFITAIALEAASAADEVIKVQIVKAGYVNPTSGN